MWENPWLGRAFQRTRSSLPSAANSESLEAGNFINEATATRAAEMQEEPLERPSCDARCCKVEGKRLIFTIKQYLLLCCRSFFPSLCQMLQKIPMQSFLSSGQAPDRARKQLRNSRGRNKAEHTHLKVKNGQKQGGGRSTAAPKSNRKWYEKAS